MFNIENIQTNNIIVWADCTYEFSNVYAYPNMYVSKINVKQGYVEDNLWGGKWGWRNDVIMSKIKRNNN